MSRRQLELPDMPEPVLHGTGLQGESLTYYPRRHTRGRDSAASADPVAEPGYWASLLEEADEAEEIDNGYQLSHSSGR